VHLIVEAYNILYQGVIEIGGGETESKALALHVPHEHPSAGSVLYGVKARYYHAKTGGK
jgi:hypothetical protein